MARCIVNFLCRIFYDFHPCKEPGTGASSIKSVSALFQVVTVGSGSCVVLVPSTAGISERFLFAECVGNWPLPVLLATRFTAFQQQSVHREKCAIFS